MRFGTFVVLGCLNPDVFLGSLEISRLPLPPLALLQVKRRGVQPSPLALVGVNFRLSAAMVNLRLLLGVEVKRALPVRSPSMSVVDNMRFYSQNPIAIYLELYVFLLQEIVVLVLELRASPGVR